MTETLHDCPKCGRSNFTERGLVHHRCRPLSESAICNPQSAIPVMNYSKRPITYRPVADLSIHPSIEDDPRLAKNDPRFRAMQNAWREAGTVPPLFVTAKGEIVDGRHKFWFAQAEAIDELPCIEVTEAEVPQVILSALAGRNHITKGQRAYLAAPKLASAFQAALERRAQILATKGRTNLSMIPSVDDLADQLGIGCRLLDQARRIHSFFAKEPKLRKEWEPKILADEDPIGLGAAIAGIGSQLSPHKATGAELLAARNSHFAHIRSWCTVHSKTVTAWVKLKPEEKDEAAVLLGKAVGTWPDEVLDTMSAAIRQARKARKEDLG